MKTVWVFGASRSIGAALVNHRLDCGDRVIGFSRTGIPSKSATLHVNVDFSYQTKTREIVRRCLGDYGHPDAAVFCQRYRPPAGMGQTEAVQESLSVEIAPALILFDEIAKTHATIPISMVLVSSVAGLFGNPDLALFYHLAKSNTLALCRYLASRRSLPNVSTNCIALGDFLKYPLDTYTAAERKKFDAILGMSPSREVTDMGQVLAGIDLFIAADVRSVRGQVMVLDGGISGLSQESIVREAVS